MSVWKRERGIMVYGKVLGIVRPRPEAGTKRHTAWSIPSLHIWIQLDPCNFSHPPAACEDKLLCHLIVRENLTYKRIKWWKLLSTWTCFVNHTGPKKKGWFFEHLHHPRDIAAMVVVCLRRSGAFLQWDGGGGCQSAQHYHYLVGVKTRVASQAGITGRWVRYGIGLLSWY